MDLCFRHRRKDDPGYMGRSYRVGRNCPHFVFCLTSSWVLKSVTLESCEWKNVSWQKRLEAGWKRCSGKQYFLINENNEGAENTLCSLLLLAMGETYSYSEHWSFLNNLNRKIILVKYHTDIILRKHEETWEEHCLKINMKSVKEVKSRINHPQCITSTLETAVCGWKIASMNSPIFGHFFLILQKSCFANRYQQWVVN